MGTNTTTHNGDSKGTNKNTEVCRVQVVPFDKVQTIADCDVITLNVLNQEHLVNPKDKGDSLEITNATEFGNGKPVTIVQNGKTILVQEKPVNETQKVADQAEEIKRSATAKYEANKTKNSAEAEK